MYRLYEGAALIMAKSHCHCNTFTPFPVQIWQRFLVVNVSPLHQQYTITSLIRKESFLKSSK